jgi:ABC-2 type transport system permease protein
MTAIYRRELGSYFNGLAGFIFAFVVLLLGGFFVMVLNIQSGSASFVNSIYNCSIILMIATPFLTMRVIAEERRQKTDQLLYSLPTTMTRVVLGKFLALATVLAVPIAVMAVYPLILNAYGSVNLSMSYGNLLAFFLMGAALISVGMFISSLTDNLVVAAGISVVVLIGDYFLPALNSKVSSGALSSFAALAVMIVILGLIMWLLTRNTVASVGVTLVLEAALTLLYTFGNGGFSGLFAKVLSALCIFDRMNQFSSGVFDIAGIVYFLAVIAVFLFLTVQAMEKRRWS